MERHQAPGNVTHADPCPIAQQSPERPVRGPCTASPVYTHCLQLLLGLSKSDLSVHQMSKSIGFL